MLGNADIIRLTEFRRALHRRPELSGEEAETARAVAAFLRPTGPDAVVAGLGGHGLAVIYDSGQPGPTVMIRAELDALPIEETGTPAHRSQVPGKAHLCGHDGHATILAGVGMVLGRARPAAGRAILLFQPAEEDGSGAAAVIADPRFAPLAPDWVFALHNMPGLPRGAVALAPGPANCASLGLRVVLTGRTAHASNPETGVAPTACIAALLSDLPRLAPASGDDFRLVTLCHTRIGAPAFGISPGEAELWLTLRTVTDAALTTLEADLRATVQRLAAQDGLGCAFTVHDHFQACSNDPDATRHLANAARAAGLPPAAFDHPMRASEDFGRFGRHGRSAMALLGAGTDLPMLHNPDYDFPDDLIAPGVALFTQVLDETLGR
nr:amidohydrolase [Pararhodobacter sp. SW119]